MKEPQKSTGTPAKPPRYKGLRHLCAATWYSMQGLASAFKGEAAFRHDILLNVANITCACIFPMTTGTRIAIISLGFVLLAVELLNTGLESLVDLVSPEWNPLAKRAKDMGSAAIFCILTAMAVAWLFVVLESL